MSQICLCAKDNNSLNFHVIVSSKVNFWKQVCPSFGFKLPLNALSLLMKRYQHCCHFLLRMS
jgi:hypothetical protein